MKGLTLIELLIVTTILLILAGIIISSLPRFQSAVELQSSVEQGMSFLLEAKSQTLSSQGGSSYGVHFEANRIVLFKGAVFVDGNPDNRVSFLSSHIEISEISLNGGGPDVVFKKLTGSSDQYGFITFRLTTDPAKSRTIRILPQGVVTMLTPPQCEWAVFANEAITIGAGSIINSYDSGGAGGNNQALVQTNTITPATFTLGTNAQINGSGVVGYQGDPNAVITLAGGAIISGSRTSASAPVVIPPASLISSPPPVSPISPPVTSGLPLTLGSGQSATVNICQDVPSEITTGTNANLTLEGDCPLNLNVLTLGSGTTLTVNGLESQIATNTFSADSNVNVIFSNAITITTPSISLGDGFSLTAIEALDMKAESFTTGTNVTIQTSGNASFMTNTFSLGSDTNIIVDGALSLTAQSLTTGTNSTIQAQQNTTLWANSASLGSGGNILTAKNFIFAANTLTTGTNATVSADNTLNIQANTGNIGAGSNLSSSTAVPKNLTFMIAGNSPFVMGTNLSFNGILYAPQASVSIGDGGNIWGSIIGKSIALGTNANLLYDIALINATCI